MFTVTKHYLVKACKTNLTFVVNKCPVNLVWLWHYLTSLIHSCLQSRDFYWSHCPVSKTSMYNFLPACMKVICIYWLARGAEAKLQPFFLLWQKLIWQKKSSTYTIKTQAEAHVTKVLFNFRCSKIGKKVRVIICYHMIALTFFANFNATKDEKYFIQKIKFLWLLQTEIPKVFFA